MSTAIIIQARMSSERLPGKVLKPLGDKTVLGWVVDTAKQIEQCEVIVATSDRDDDDAIVTWCAEHDVTCFRGSLDDVLARYYACAKMMDAQRIIRLTADCPLLDAAVINQVLEELKEGKADYVGLDKSWPHGLDCEAFTFEVLEQAKRKAIEPEDREHVTRYIYTHSDTYKCVRLPCPHGAMDTIRITLDSQEDYEMLCELVKCIDNHASYTDVVTQLRLHPEIYAINAHIKTR